MVQLQVIEEVIILFTQNHFLVMGRRWNFSNHRPDYKHVGIKGRLFAQGYGKQSYQNATKTCSMIMYQVDLKGIPFKPKTWSEIKLIAKHFQTILPIWVNDNCTLIGATGEIIKNVPCDQKHNFVCELKIQEFHLRKPKWIEHIPGKEYAVAYSRQSNSYHLKANYYEARYICNHVFNGSHLVEPTNQREQEMITSRFSGGSVWLGFNDFKTFNHWVKDSDGSEMTYSNWRMFRPWYVYRGNLHCAVMSLVCKGKTCSSF